MLKIDEYVLIETEGDHMEVVTHGYDNLEAAVHSMENYYDKEANIRVAAFFA